MKLKDKLHSFSNPDMLKGPIWGSLVSFAIPVFFSLLFQSLYNMVDSLIVGHALGEAAYAAVGSGGVVCDLLIVFATGMGLGMSMVIARRYGANDSDGIKKASVACLVIGVGLSLIATIFGLIFLEKILHLLNTPQEIYADAYNYARIIVINIFACFLYNMFCGMLKALGNSFTPLLYLMFSSLLNIALDSLFVLVLHRGVAGVAEATAISQAISALLTGYYIVKRAPILIPEKKHFHFDGALYLEIIWSGLSMGLMSAIVNFGTLILQYGINSLGTLTIAAHTAARKIYSFGTLPLNAIASAVSMLVSQNYGARQYERIRTSLKYCYLFDFGYAFIITAIFWIFSESAIRLITGSDSVVVIQNGTAYLHFVGPFYFVLGVLIDSRYALQGIGQKILPMVSSVIELVGKIVFTFAFVPIFGYMAVVACEPLIWCAMTVQLLISLYTRPEMKKDI